MLADYYIGDLVDPPPEQQLPAPAANGTHTLTNGHANGHAKGHTTANGTSDSLVTLNPREKISLTLTEKQIISPDTRIFRFALPSAEHTLGLPTGKHVLVYGKTADGQTVARAYTPVSDDKDTGRLDLLVKVYFASPDYPEGGKMSQLMEGLQIGDSLQFKGPTGHFTYMGKGEYTLHKHQGRARRLSMVAGGTGEQWAHGPVTPCMCVPHGMHVMHACAATHGRVVRSCMHGAHVLWSPCVCVLCILACVSMVP